MTKRALVSVVVALGLGAGAGACGGGGASAASFCSLVKKDAASFKPSGEASAVAELKKVERAAPSAIKGDMKTLTDYLDSISSSAPQVPPASELAKLQSATKNIETYAKDQCHVDLTSNT